MKVTQDVDLPRTHNKALQPTPFGVGAGAAELSRSKDKKTLENILEELIEIFEKSNEKFLINEKKMIERDVSERSLCGSLKDYLKENLSTKYNKYRFDLEYNRNIGNIDSKKHIKATMNNQSITIPIVCDLILHSRGQNIREDNLLAIEMKKSYRSLDEKNKDRIRLKEMTKTFEQINWMVEKNKLPKYICGYKLGIYYEINNDTKIISLEYYSEGELFHSYNLEY